ncbi:MAG: ATP-binding protein [Betaproteobacteria bacterium]
MNPRRLLALPRTPGPGTVAAFVLAYVALDWISFIDPVGPLGITPWNPAPGLALFLLLRHGMRFAPWLFVAVMAAEIIVRGAPAPWPALFAIATVLTSGYGLLGSLLRGRLEFRQDIATLRDATVFVFASAVATGAIALAVVWVFVASGTLSPDHFAHSIAQYWVGDLIGVVVTTPILLVAARAADAGVERSRLESAAQVAAILVALWIVFGSGIGEELQLFYVLFLPLIWIAMRRGVAGSAFAALLMQLGVIAALTFGGHVPGAVLGFQVLLLVLAPTGLFLGAAVEERRATEQRLRDKQVQLDRSLRAAAASELASVLAHELNQPLSAVGTYARACQLLIENGDPASELSTTLNKVAAEANRAGVVIRRLREFVLTGSLRRERIDVASLLADAAAATRMQAHRLGVALSVEVAPMLPEVSGDRIQLETVLHNLVANAIEALKDATGKKTITLTAIAHDSRIVRICVADNGPGVQPQIAATLFERLTSSKVQGLGLGLPISRTIVEAHGGRLWLEPTTRGACFCLTLMADGHQHA